MTAVITRTPAATALRKTELISAVGIGIGALEQLSHLPPYEDGGLISWRVGRTRFKKLSGEKADVLDNVMSPPGLQRVIALRLAAAALIANSRTNRATRTVAMGYLAVTNWLLHSRNGLGGDGTDHMNMLTCAALTVGSAYPSDNTVQEACARFITAQSVLSYAAAGAAKLVSPYWRSGVAMPGIFRTHSYGDERLYSLFTRFPILAKLGGWGTIVGELSFPLVLVAPRKMALGLLGTGTAFHIGNSVFMGLNRFIWAFCGTYPAVAHCSRGLSRSGGILRALRSKR